MRHTGLCVVLLFIEGRGEKETYLIDVLAALGERVQTGKDGLAVRTTKKFKSRAIRQEWAELSVPIGFGTEGTDHFFSKPLSPEISAIVSSQGFMTRSDMGYLITWKSSFIAMPGELRLNRAA